MISLLKNHPVFFCLWLLYAGLLILFPLRMQAMESYAYAAAIEGYYNLSATFALASGGVALPDISRYHPNHPLGPALAGFIYDNAGISVFDWLRFWNTAWALALFPLFYGFLQLLAIRKTAAALFALAFMLSYGIWSMALSAEMHMPALGLTLVAALFLLRYLDLARPSLLLLSAVIFTLATAFHLAAALCIVPAFAALLRQKWRREYGHAALIFLTGFLIFYVLLPVVVLHLHSVGQFFRTFLIYKSLAYARYEGIGWLAVAAKTALRSVLFLHTDFSWLMFPVFSVLAAIAVRGARLLQVPDSVKVLVVGLPVTYFAAHLLLGARPDGLNGWLFILPSFFAFFAAALPKQGRLETIFAATIVIILFALNFWSAILPNAQMPPAKAAFFSPPEGMPAHTPVAFVVENPTLTFAEIWKAGSVYGYRQQRVFLPCCGEKDAASRLVQWLHENRDFILVSDQAQDQAGVTLRQSGIPFRQVIARADFFDDRWLPSSIYFERPRGYRIRKQLMIYSSVQGG